MNRSRDMICFSFECFSPRARCRAVPVKEGGRAVGKTWLPTPSYCPLGTGTWKDFLNIHCVAQNNILLCSSNQQVADLVSHCRYLLLLYLWYQWPRKIWFPIGFPDHTLSHEHEHRHFQCRKIDHYIEVTRTRGCITGNSC